MVGKRGRPTIHPSLRRKNFTSRMRDNLRVMLTAQAELNGRSLSEEIEFRLEQSFHTTDVVLKTVAAVILKMEEEADEEDQPEYHA